MTTALNELVSTTERGRAMRAHFRARLRDARAAVLANAEGFEAIAYVLEEIGRFLMGEKGTASLNDYLPQLAKLVRRADLDGEVFLRRGFIFRQSRNDRMHSGSHARDAAAVGVQLTLVLEEALSGIGWQNVTLGDLMSREVVAAQPWATLNEVRLQMLRHAFTVIPSQVDGSWYLLTDRWLAQRLAGMPRTERDRELARTVEDVIRTLENDRPATTELMCPEDGLETLRDRFKHGAVLVSDGREPSGLGGIISPADVL